MDHEELEKSRLRFVVESDGKAAAITFAQQGIGQYGSAIREAEAGGNQYGNVYRAELQASVRVYQAFIEQS